MDGSFEYSPIHSISLGRFFEEHISIQPNPFRDELDIRLPADIPMGGILDIRDSYGRLVYSERLGNSAGIHVSLHHLNPGMYFVSLRFGDRGMHRKIIRE